jgi:CRISPR system Cascade subunit CasE
MILTQAHIPYDIVAREWKDGGFRDSYAWHKRIWEAFPGKPDAGRDFLTRLEDTGQNYRLLMLSKDEPVRPGWCPEDGWASKEVPPSFFQHSHYRFTLLANPTRKLVVRDEQGNRKKNGRRIPLTRREDLLGWLSRKGGIHGFRPDLGSLKTNPRPRQPFLKKGGGGTHTATEFSGLLEVTDTEAFQAAACKGIGPAKAFGFGMLCLVPVNPA